MKSTSTPTTTNILPRESRPLESSRYAHYFGLTKVGVSAVFLLKQSPRRSHTTPRLGFSN